MKPGDRIYWLRHDSRSGSRAILRNPAIFIGLKERGSDTANVFVMEDGAIKRRHAKTHNLLDRTEDKEIDVATEGLALYNGPVPTQPQMRALSWLKENGGLEVPNMNMDGRSKEWPTKQTLDGLLERGLITFEQKEFTWEVKVNPMGEAILNEHSVWSRAA